MEQNEYICFMIKIISESVEKVFNKQLREFDLTIAQVRILAYLRGRYGVKTSQKDIEDHFGVTHPTVIGILGRLESKGLISSEIDDKDKRVENICLTEKEASVYHVMEDFQRKMELKLLQGLSDEQAEGLRRWLKLIYKNVQDG